MMNFAAGQMNETVLEHLLAVSNCKYTHSPSSSLHVSPSLRGRSLRGCFALTGWSTGGDATKAARFKACADQIEVVAVGMLTSRCQTVALAAMIGRTGARSSGLTRDIIRLVALKLPRVAAAEVVRRGRSEPTCHPLPELLGLGDAAAVSQAERDRALRAWQRSRRQLAAQQQQRRETVSGAKRKRSCSAAAAVAADGTDTQTGGSLGGVTKRRR